MFRGFGHLFEFSREEGKLIKTNFSKFYQRDKIGLTTGLRLHSPILADVVKGHLKDLELSKANKSFITKCPNKIAAIIGAILNDKEILKNNSETNIFLSKLLIDLQCFIKIKQGDHKERDRHTNMAKMIENKGETKTTFYDIVKHYNFEIEGYKLDEDTLNKLSFTS